VKAPSLPLSCVGLGRGLSKPRFAGLGDNLPLLRLKRRMNCFPSMQHPSAALPSEGMREPLNVAISFGS
jgi:hypothetical protein